MSKFVDFFKHILGQAEIVIEPAIVKVIGADAAHKLGVATIALLGTDAGILVKDAVALVSTLKIAGADGKLVAATGSEQRKAALVQLESDAKFMALGLTSSFVNLLVEIAVQWVEKGGALAATAAVAAVVA